MVSFSCHAAKCFPSFPRRLLSHSDAASLALLVSCFWFMYPNHVFQTACDKLSQSYTIHA